MNITEIKKFIEEREHWKKGPKYWAEYLDVPLTKVHTALGTRKEDNEYKSFDLDKDKTYENEYQAFLEKNGIAEEDVVQVYYKEKASGVRFTVQTRKYKDDLNNFDATEEYKKAISEYTPPKFNPVRTLLSIASKKRIAIINLFDAHIDKICSTRVGDKDSTVSGNIELFEGAFDEILSSIAQKCPEEIVIPLGNDFWHTNDFTRNTKKGTHLGESVGLDPRVSFRIGLNLLRSCIDKAQQVAPVKLIFIRGNHDSDKVAYLLESLLIAYENQSSVEVVDSLKSRQYHRYGKWLFGFAHGDKERKPKDLPSLMSTDEEGKKHWSEIDRGVFFLGDLHHEMRYDYRGCTVIYLRSMNSEDEWHWEEGYTSQLNTAYGFVYEKDGSREFEFKVNI